MKCMTFSANSSSSCEGSAPGVVTNKTGVVGVVSSFNKRGRLSEVPASDFTPNTSHTNCTTKSNR